MRLLENDWLTDNLPSPTRIHHNNLVIPCKVQGLYIELPWSTSNCFSCDCKLTTAHPCDIIWQWAKPCSAKEMIVCFYIHLRLQVIHCIHPIICVSIYNLQARVLWVHVVKHRVAFLPLDAASNCSDSLGELFRSDETILLDDSFPQQDRLANLSQTSRQGPPG